jgi:hypothetical protein
MYIALQQSAHTLGEMTMKRKNFDKIVTAVGFGLTVFLFVAAGLLNWGSSFAADSVKSQLENQNISFPAAEGMPATTKVQLTKWAGMAVTTGPMAKDFSDLYIWEHMKAASIGAVGKPATYSEVSGMYMGLIKGGSTDTAQIAKLADLRQTLFMGNTLRGMLLEAYAFGTMGVIAGYGALAALIGGFVMLLLSIAGLLHIRRTPDSATI